MENRVFEFDDFETRYQDVENELRNYSEEFNDKTVYLSCDNPVNSAFWRYFSIHFEELNLKKLTAVYIRNTDTSFRWDIVRGDSRVIRTELSMNGDFRNSECLSILQESDIVVTNPPQSLFSEFIDTVMDFNKKFIIMGHIGDVIHENVIRYIMNGDMWLGETYGDLWFRIRDEDLKAKVTDLPVRRDSIGRIFSQVPGSCWFTNLDNKRRHTDLPLVLAFEDYEYPEYDDYDAIDCSNIVQIPFDYEGAVGVPLSYLFYHNPLQYTLLGLARPMYGGQLMDYRLFIEKYREPVTYDTESDYMDYLTENLETESEIKEDAEPEPQIDLLNETDIDKIIQQVNLEFM